MKTTLKSLLFHVEKLLVSDVLNADTISSTEYGIFGYPNGNGKRRGKPMLINTCSNVYELVPNSEVFPKIERMLRKSKIDYSVTYKMLDNSRFYADYQLKTGGVSVGNRKDQIFPIIRVEHSYNGLLKYKLTFGWFRLICSNGLTVPVEGKEAENFTIVGKHTKQIKQSIETLFEKIEFFTKNSGKLVEKFNIIAERWVESWEERVISVVEASGVGLRGAKFNKKTEQFEGEIFDKIRQEANELYKGKVNDWLIYNGINYHIYNAVTKEGKPYDTAPNLRHDQDRKVFETLYEMAEN
jgi:hypothetical protein